MKYGACRPDYSNIYITLLFVPDVVGMTSEAKP